MSEDYHINIARFQHNLDKVLAAYKARKDPKYGFGPAEGYAIEAIFYIKHAAKPMGDPVKDALAEMAEWIK
jgi:hypothetical protein